MFTVSLILVCGLSHSWDTLALGVKEIFIQSLSSFLFFGGIKGIAFKTSLELYFRPLIIEFFWFAYLQCTIKGRCKEKFWGFCWWVGRRRLRVVLPGEGGKWLTWGTGGRRKLWMWCLILVERQWNLVTVQG